MGKKRTIWAIMSILLVASLLLVGCQPAEEAPEEAAPVGEEAAPEEEAAPVEEVAAEPVGVAFVGPMTGPDGVDGLGAANAAQLAVSLANEAGGICGGRTVEITAHDTKADPKEGANIATLLCSDDSVLGVAADYNSSVALAEAPVFNECGLVQVNYYAAAPGIPEKGGPYTFRVYPPGENQSKYKRDRCEIQGSRTGSDRRLDPVSGWRLLVDAGARPWPGSPSLRLRRLVRS